MHVSNLPATQAQSSPEKSFLASPEIPHFLQVEDSLLFSKKVASGPCFESDGSSLHPPVLFIEDAH
jgi:hypothetical protein